MGDLEEKLEGILSDPSAMAQIMSLAQSLNLGGNSSQNSEEGQPEQTVSPPSPPAPPAAIHPSGGGAGGLLEGLSSLDPRMLSAAANLFGQYHSGGDDKRVALLNALRPFVREERYAKLDKALQIAKLSRVIRSALDLFRAAKEDRHV